MRRATASLLLLTAVACGVVEPGPSKPATVRSPIVGGTATTGDPSVFMLIIEASTGATSLCTATLIDRRTLLTAAHCADPALLNASSLTITASNAPTLPEALEGQGLVAVQEIRRHPDWNRFNLSNDLALLLLTSAPDVAPKPWNAADLGPFDGAAVRALGYGTTGAAGGDGVKRVVDLTIRQLTSSKLFVGNDVDKGICHGDSGGPTFLTFLDGVERVVGVHSYTVNQPGGPVCVFGADTRVDAFQGFVRAWLAEKEAPTCADDGRCVMGCAPVDVDCLCAADGACSSACPNLSRDPDCPRDCGDNGVCATATCPVADPDCAGFGEACRQPAQCQHRACVLDAQHPSPYCSRPCAAAADCPSGYECAPQGHCQHQQLPAAALGEACVKGSTWCGAVGVCTGASPRTTVCALPCVDGTSCAAPRRCEPGYDSVRRCVDPPPVVLPLASTSGPAATGCATAPGELLVLLGLVTLRRRRRS